MTQTAPNHSMATRSYQLRFLTPAFLGNAEQRAQWRTPPFKALLRQWWRVVYAAEHHFKVDLQAMRKAEGDLFGHAGLQHASLRNEDSKQARQSLLRMRLSPSPDPQRLGLGTQQGVQPLSPSPDTSYAWFGLIDSKDRTRDRTAISTNGLEGKRTLSLAFPAVFAREIEQACALIHALGLVGSRSRGGWGSIHLEPTPALGPADLGGYARDLETCLITDWAMSLSRDEQGLMIWESQALYSSWDQAMKAIATLRKEVRTELKVSPDLRFTLGFADKGQRMPSPLRWKPIQLDNGQLTIRVFAMPHKIPEMAKQRFTNRDLSRTWRIVSQCLDERLTRAAQQGAKA